jgi:hypothetical protein
MTLLSRQDHLCLLAFCRFAHKLQNKENVESITYRLFLHVHAPLIPRPTQHPIIVRLILLQDLSGVADERVRAMQRLRDGDAVGGLALPFDLR